LGRAVDLAGLTASFRAHVNIVSFLTYLLTYLLLVRRLLFIVLCSSSCSSTDLGPEFDCKISICSSCFSGVLIIIIIIIINNVLI